MNSYSFFRRVKNVQVELQVKVESGASEASCPAQLWLEVQLQRFSLVGEKTERKKNGEKIFKNPSPKC